MDNIGETMDYPIPEKDENNVIAIHVDTYIIIHKEPALMAIHRMTALAIGRNPTAFSTRVDNPVPIKKRVNVRPFFAAVTTHSE